MKRLLAILFLASPAMSSQQVIVSGLENATNATSARFTGLMSGMPQGTATTENTRTQVVAASGTLRALRVVVNVAPGVGKSGAYTVRVNVTNTALTCTNSDAGLGCTNDSRIPVVKGDRVSFGYTPTGTPVGSTPTWTMVFESSVTSESIYPSSCGSGVNNTNNTFCAVGGNAAAVAAANEVQAASVVSTSGTIKSLYVRFASAPAAGKSLACTLRKNGATPSGAPTCTVSDAAVVCGFEDPAGFHVVPGDTIDLLITPTGTPTVSAISFGINFIADNKGEFMIAQARAGNDTNSATTYRPLATGNAAAAGDEATAQQLGQAWSPQMRFTGYFCTASAAAGAAKSWTSSIRKNKTTDTLSVVITGATQVYGSDETNNATVANDDLLANELIPTGTPTAARVACSARAIIRPRRLSLGDL